MALVLAINWWSPVIRGIVAIVLGILALAWPGITLGAMALLFGAYALIDGIVSLAGLWRASKTRERWGALLEEVLRSACVSIFRTNGDSHWAVLRPLYLGF